MTMVLAHALHMGLGGGDPPEESTGADNYRLMRGMGV